MTTPQSLEKFVNFCKQHIKGSEKREAQTFLDRFFQAFGHEGAMEAGAIFEEAIKKGSKTGRTGFADLVWKPRVLIEMKKRGEDLNKHYSQAFEYWSRLVPDRPRYVILCNFDEFWIFDFDSQLDTPVDKVTLEHLPQRSTAFAFMEIANRNPVFRNNQMEVTEKAAKRMAELLLELEKRGIEKLPAQRFILQCVLAMFSEDRNLLPRDIFISCIQDCLSGESSYDVLGGLFREMNNPGITPAGRYKGVNYFNGGLFSVIQVPDLSKEELKFLDTTAREDWSKVRPAIFGSLFEGTVDKIERHKRGIHFTSEADIMKIVRPTISKYWEEKIEEATTLGELNGLQMEMQSYKVLDPACGSGNFLYIAYQELKRIEQTLLEKISERKRVRKDQIGMGFVTPQQFYGTDTNQFAVELARVTLMIGRKIAIDNLELTEPALPLDTLDKNIVCQDALFNEWVRADAIIGNPPFLGGKHMRKALGDEYVDKIFAKFSNVKDSVDFCSYWFRLAHDNIDENGRIGLVGTNSIRQGKSRVATLDYITQSQGYIHETISTQPWSGEAKVHVSIVNWSKRTSEKLYLDNKLVTYINSSLQSTIDVTKAVQLEANKKLCFQGVLPVGEKFIVTEQQVKEWIKADSKNKEVLKLFSMGENLATNPHGKPKRWIIDFNQMPVEEASLYRLPFEYIKIHVKSEREKNRDAGARRYYWRFLRPRPAMRKNMSSLSLCFAVGRVSKWGRFIPYPVEWLPGDKTVIVTTDDFYIFGILSSSTHLIWVKAQEGTLKADIAYAHEICFFAFPSPQEVSSDLTERIRSKAKELHEYRSKQMDIKNCGITTLYNEFFNEPTSQLYKIHNELDTLVVKAYGFDPESDILEQIFNLNLELAQKEKNKEKVIGAYDPNETSK
jgi:methylase of polypeptide subunit release factors